MKVRLHIIIILFIAGIFATGARSVSLNYFSVELNPANQNEAILSWTVANLTEVRRFEVHRKMGNQSYQHLRDATVEITDLILRNPSQEFRYTDRNLFKSSENVEDVEYILRIVQHNGINIDHQRSIQYTTSAARRTWGSIKSMFQ
jgi:hypothetical protein